MHIGEKIHMIFQYVLLTASFVRSTGITSNAGEFNAKVLCLECTTLANNFSNDKLMFLSIIQNDENLYDV